MARIRKKIQRVPRSPRKASGIRIEGASSTQDQEMLMSGEVYPDRTAVPLVLQPYCSYTDATTGKEVPNALPEVTDGQWYRLTDSNRSLGLCESTKLPLSLTAADPDGNAYNVFSVVSTPGATDYGRLTIKENVPAGEQITYVFTGTLTADGSELRAYFNSRCTAKTEIPDIVFDNNATGVYNPLDDPQYFTVNPSLSIPGITAVWSWKSYHEMDYNGWGALGGTQLDWCIEQVGDGIKIDRRVMPDMILLKCVAEINIDGVAITLEKVFSHTRVMPPYEADSIRVGEITEDVDAICPYAMIKVGDREVTDASEFRTLWYNSSGAVVGEGINPTIPLSRLNADSVYELEVLDRGGWQLLIDNGALVEDNGELIRVRTVKDNDN